jgi:putative ABC transport system permease protein
VPKPPRFAETLLRCFVSPEDAEALTGDLEEMMVEARHPRRWYLQQVLSIVAARTRQRFHAHLSADPRRLTMAFRQDVAYAFRSLRKEPLFAVTSIVLLALGIGANVAMFSLLNAVLLKPLPFADPDRLMLVQLLAPDREAPGVLRPMIWSYPKYGVFRDGQRVFESTAVYGAGNWNLTGTSLPDRIGGEYVEPTYFGVLGVTPLVGRTFSADDARAPGSTPLVVLGHTFWRQRFASDASIVGRTIGLNGIPHTVVGILPRGFRGLTGQADVWVPITTLNAEDLGNPFDHSYDVVARRRTGVAAGQADSAVRILGAEIDARFRAPQMARASQGNWSATAVSLDDQRVAPIVRRSILLMLGAVGSVLLIVCINLANLMLFRTLSRQREVAIRLALGASRIRIVRQLMTESCLLAVVGAAAGIGIAYLAIHVGAAGMPPDIRLMVSPSASLAGAQTVGLMRVGFGLVGLDISTLVFTVVIAVGASILFGLGPAWSGSRRDLSMAIKARSAASSSQATRRFALRNLLVVAEIALALVVLTAGGLMVKSVARLQSTPLGFRPDALLSFRVPLAAPRYNSRTATDLLQRLMTALAARPDVEAVAFGSCAPISGGCNRTTITFPDRPALSRGADNVVEVLWASPKYFDTLGIRLVGGRGFSDRDRPGQPKVVVINETAARTYWGAEDPIGKRIAVGQGGFGDGAEVVGIVQDVKYGSVDIAVLPGVYLPQLQSIRSGGLIFVRSRTRPATLVAAVRSELGKLDPDLPLVSIMMMDERFGEATWRTRISAWLLGGFAALALALSALGLYGVISQGVEQRRREIGVRMAVGADRAHILRLIIGRVLVIALSGLALGLVCAVPAMRILTALLYQVRPTDPLIFSGLALLLLAVALLAGYIPARRATRVDPLATLRAE